MELIINLVIMCILGFVCAAIARNRGRNTVGWFFGGFFLGILGLIIVLVLPNLKEQEAKERHMKRENRRLREQLRQEQVKGEAFRRHAASRLDLHDEAVGIDTRGAAPALTASGPATAGRLAGPGASASAAAGADADDDETQWYFERDGDAVGPLSRRQITRYIRQGKLRSDTLVWSENMDDWQPACKTSELQSALREAAS